MVVNKKFKPCLLKGKISDKTLSFAPNESRDKELGKSMSYRSEGQFHLNLNQKALIYFQ
jgi:hypothetical protein